MRTTLLRTVTRATLSAGATALAVSLLTHPATSTPDAPTAAAAPAAAPVAPASDLTPVASGQWNPDDCKKPAQEYRVGPANRQSAPTHTDGTEKAPIARIGVVSFNAFHDLSHLDARRDAWNLMHNKHVDVIGVQEGEFFNRDWKKIAAKNGFGVVTFPGKAGTASYANALMIAYRKSTFTYTSSAAYREHKSGRGTAPGGKHGFPSRWTVRATLKHKATGRTITFLNGHMNQQAEAFCTRPGVPTGTLNSRMHAIHARHFADRYNDTPSYATFGMGDFNWDYTADRAVKTPNGPWAQFRGKWASSYDLLGVHYVRTADGRMDGLAPTHIKSRRYIDYVLTSKATINQHRAVVRGHWALPGYHSDHMPLLALVDLYAN